MDPQKDEGGRMKEDIHLPSAGDPDTPQRPIRDYLEAIEQAAPEDKAAKEKELIQAMGPTGKGFTALIEQIKEVSRAFNKIQPFMDTIFEAYPRDEWFMIQPLTAITIPIGAYMQSNGLEDGTDIEAHKEAFLEFFGEYIAALEQAYKEDGPAFDLEAAQRELLEGLRKEGLIDNLIDFPQQDIIRTIYPLTFISPIDKVTKLAFAGELTEQLQPLAMESRKSKRPVTTFASINFNAPQIQGLKGLNYNDYIVYCAICTLYSRGGNEYITYQMIYQVMTGNKGAYLNPKQEADIKESVTKFMYGGIHIDATEEVKRHNISGSFLYETNMLHAERGRYNLNGTITECIHIIRPPVLLEYSSNKNQIYSIPIKALAIPVNNSSDILALKQYLINRVSAMKGTDPQRDIAYTSIYSAVWGKEASSTKTPKSGYIRVKKSRLRENIMKILEYWTTEKGGALIKGFKEYGPEKNRSGVTISL